MGHDLGPAAIAPLDSEIVIPEGIVKSPVAGGGGRPPQGGIAALGGDNSYWLLSAGNAVLA